MQTETINIFTELATIAPVVAVLLLVLYFMYKEIKELKQKNEQLQTELRTSEKEVISNQKDLNITLEKLIESLK
jgi:predicted Holliday junction resolvase-like endonuclease